MTLKETAYGIFHPGWFAGGVLLGLGLQVLAWTTSVGLFGGLSGYLVMGAVVGGLSSGDTIVEPGVAAFVVATLGFVVDHFVLSLLGVGIPLAVGYGAVALVVAVFGGWIGERLQAAV